MAAKIDLTGQTFGKLMAVLDTGQRDKSSGGVVWLWQCLCGNECEINGAAVTSGHTQSCGCKAKEKKMPMRISKTNQRHFMLTVVKDDQEIRMPNGRRGVLVKCDCSAVVIIAKSQVGRQQSCGCIRRKFNNIKGQVFGKLKVLEPTQERSTSGSVIWVCVCECGNKCKAAGNALKSGNTKSCGCGADENRALLADRNKKTPETSKSGWCEIHQIPCSTASTKFKCKCDNCFSYRAESQVQLRIARQSQGLCGCGRTPVDGQKCCQQCIMRATEHKTKLINQGLCGDCGKNPLVTKTRCWECADNAAVRNYINR